MELLGFLIMFIPAGPIRQVWWIEINQSRRSIHELTKKFQRIPILNTYPTKPVRDDLQMLGHCVPSTDAGFHAPSCIGVAKRESPSIYSETTVDRHHCGDKKATSSFELRQTISLNSRLLKLCAR